MLFQCKLGRGRMTSDQWLALTGLLAAAVVMRFSWLGLAAFRADTIHFWHFCHLHLSFSSIFLDWMELMGRSAQLPWPAALTVGFIQWFHLPVTDATIRAADAMLGVVAVTLAYGAGRALLGHAFGLYFGLLLMLNPYHIQLSREAYFYSSLVVGAMSLLWLVIVAWQGRRRGTIPGWWFGLAAAGFFMSAYSHFMGWLLSLVTGFFLAFLLWRSCYWTRSRGRSIVFLLVPALVALPLFFVDWGVPYIWYDLTHPEVKASSLNVMGKDTTPVWLTMTHYLTAMSWGDSLIGIGVLGSAVLLLVWGVVRRRHLGRSWRMMLLILVASSALYAVVKQDRAVYAAARHVSFLFPLCLLLLTVGLWQIHHVTRGCAQRAAAWRRLITGVFLAVAPLYLLPSAWSALRLTGQPTPYKDIVRWMDTHLPSGTPVLVDRWFEPWNELKVYNSTNVCFTFTIPNEPADVYLKHNWRQTAEQFFEKYPDAAYLEIAKSYWENPDIGPWSWPRQHFKQHVILRNEAGLKLRDLGLLYREDGGIYTNRLIVEIFYNTPEDVMAKAKVEGRQVIALYGPGWGYIKPGWQNGDFRDWRVLKGRATMDIYNLNTQPRTVTVRITGVAAGGTKHVRIGTQILDCEADRLMEWNLAPITLQPGLNALVWQDARWDRGAQVPLLVDGFTVNVVDKSE